MAKWEDYLEEGHYGLDLDVPKVVDFLDKIFEDLTKIPNFKYAQIKSKFSWYCFYADPISGTMQMLIEQQIKKIMDVEGF